MRDRTRRASCPCGDPSTGSRPASKGGPMNAGWTRHRILSRFVILSAVITAASVSCIARAGSVGRLVLHIRGELRDLVLFDPVGRTDQYDHDIEKAGIPGCDRWPGGLEEDEEDVQNVDSVASARTTFQIESVQFGRYFVYARAETSAVVTISVTFGSAIPGSTTSCTDLSRTDRVGAGRHAWAIDVRRSPPKGECAVRIGPMGRGLKTAKRR